METRCPYCSSEYTHLNRRRGVWECEDCGLEFDVGGILGEAAPPQRAERPLKIFLSYPHSSVEICREIRDALVRRGHQVWFDERDLPHGADWRREIEAGVEGSNAVVSCLTRDAVRVVDTPEGSFRGVCLDELAIALNTPGCVVESVLLEPDEVVRPSAALCRRQWLDMSAWRDMRERSDEAYRGWFDAKMRQVIEMVESDRSYEFTGEVREVKRLLPMADWNMGKEYLLRRPYAGRDWLRAKVDSWLADPKGGEVCAVYGDPGVGKSAFAVHYSFSSPSVAASLCFTYGNERYNSMPALVQSVAYQLACRLPGYRRRLIALLKETPAGFLADAELLDRLVLRPLTLGQIDGGHETVCVVLDGLDECSGAEGNAAMRLIRGCRGRLPRWLRLLVVSRPDADVLTGMAPDRVLWLRRNSYNNMRDVEAYLDEALSGHIPDEAQRAKAASRLTYMSGGVFLFAEKAAEAVSRGAHEIPDETTCPSSLDELFYGWFERAFPDAAEYRARWRVPVGAIVASPQPLPVEELERLLGLSQAEAGDLERALGSLVNRGEGNLGAPTIGFSHRYVADWVTSDRAGAYAAPCRDALRALALGCHRTAATAPGTLTLYEALNLMRLLESCDMGCEMDECLRNRALAMRMAELGVECLRSDKPSLAVGPYRDALRILELLDKKLGTPQAGRDLSVVQEGYARVQKALVWGPRSRDTFTWESLAPYVTFNSITNNPAIGDERNFVRVREAGTDDKFVDMVHVVPGKEYEVYIWFHNNASANLAAKGVAQNVKLASDFPTKLKAGQAGQVKATIAASNAKPTEVWDSANLVADSTVYLRYVGNSAVIHSRGSVDGTVINSKALFGRGVNLAFDKRFWGIVPGCSEFAGYVLYRIKVDQPNWWSEILVRNGDSGWQEWLDAKPGDTLDFKIFYKNTGTVKQVSVKLFDVLPVGLELIEGTVLQDGDNLAKAVTVGNELFSKSGLVIGDFYPGQTATVTYQARVKEDAPCGGAEIYNAMRCVTANGAENDRVEITVA